MIGKKTKALFVLHFGGGRISFPSVCAALEELGIQYELTRRDNGWSMRVGQKGKLADTLILKFNGKTYSSDRHSGVKAEYAAADIFSSLDASQTKELKIHYHGVRIAEHNKAIKLLSA